MAGNLHLELVEELAEEGVAIPVILMTGHPSAHTAIRALQLPVIAYLVKPFEFEDLLVEVQAGVHLIGLNRTICNAQCRAEITCQSLRDIAEALKTMPKTMLSAPLKAFFTLTMQNIVHGMFDWERVTENLLESNKPQADSQEAEAALFRVHRKIFEDAIKTLEKTKGAFKSRELGDLRKRLQDFLKIN
jgi:CheY-like chemotaxis protein